MEIDFTCPQQVFDRIAQLDHETRERLTKINKIQNEQYEADAECDRLERLAIAYLRATSEPVAIRAKAIKSGYSWNEIPYAITIDHYRVDTIPLTSVIELNELTAEQIEAALEELIDEDDAPDVTEDEHFVAQHQDDGLIKVVARNFQPTGGH